MAQMGVLPDEGSVSCSRPRRILPPAWRRWGAQFWILSANPLMPRLVLGSLKNLGASSITFFSNRSQMGVAFQVSVTPLIWAPWSRKFSGLRVRAHFAYSSFFGYKEAGNTPFCPSQGKFRTFVLRARCQKYF